LFDRFLRLWRRACRVISALERTVSRDDGNPFMHAMLAAIYAKAGEAAMREVAEVRRQNPLFDLDTFGTLFRNPAHRDKIVRDPVQKPGASRQDRRRPAAGVDVGDSPRPHLILRSRANTRIHMRAGRLEGWATDKVLVPPFETRRFAALLRVRRSFEIEPRLT
jgi:hypothetical protein